MANNSVISDLGFDIAEVELSPMPITPLKVLSWREMENAAPVDWLVKGLLTSTALSVVYGEPGSGKSFFAMALGAYIAKGKKWWENRRVAQGAVVYLGLEGGRGLQSRVLAFQQYSGWLNIPFYLVPTGLDLLQPEGDLTSTIETINALNGVVLVVVDTLSRAIAGGNENSPDDMGAFIRNMDRIRLETGAHVMCVHHGGKDKERGARGHSSLKAAADTEIEITNIDGIRLAKVTKQKDGEGGAEFAFCLEKIELGIDEDGDPITSCICVQTDSIPQKKRVTGQAKIALQLLEEAIAKDGQIPPASNHIPPNISACSLRLWQEYCKSGQISDPNKPDAFRMAFKRASQKLQELGIIGFWSDWVWICK